MWRGFLALLKKDIKLMLSGRFFLLALGSLILYSCYINFVYINLDQNIYPVYLYDPLHTQSTASAEITEIDSIAGTAMPSALTLPMERRKLLWFHLA